MRPRSCSDTDPKRLGRPRSAEADRAILAAATDLFCDHGLDGLSVEAIAERAGVSKATIYRRYASKTDIVTAAMDLAAEEKPPIRDTGDLRADLVALLRTLAKALRSTEVGRALPMLIAEKQRNRELAEAHERFVALRRAASKAVLQRGVESGAIDPDADLDVMIDMLVGPVFYRCYHSGTPLGERAIGEIVDAALLAFAP